MLKSVIKDKNLSSKSINGKTSGSITFSAGYYWDSWQFFGKESRLVACLNCIEQNISSIGDNVDCSCRCSFIAAA